MLETSHERSGKGIRRRLWKDVDGEVKEDEIVVVVMMVVVVLEDKVVMAG